MTCREALEGKGVKILEELKGCILDLDTPTALEVPRLMRRMLELHSELVVRVESLELEVQENHKLKEALRYLRRKIDGYDSTFEFCGFGEFKEEVTTCRHLADSDRPSTGLSAEPCKLCGRYFVDD